MRLLVTHAQYAGPERRVGGRVAMAAPVRLRGAAGGSLATLIQLSHRGCGLVTRYGGEVGEVLETVLPPELTGEASLALPGIVVEVTPETARAGAGLAVVFDPVEARVARVLDGVMQRHSLGFGALPRKLGSGCDAGEGAADADDQREGPRKLFAGRVVAADRDHPRVMIGRDLSLGGMRVRPVDCLQLGDEFTLALYGDGDDEALVVAAVVARDEGWDGLVLHFRRITPEIRRRLERLVDCLPAARPEAGAGARAAGELVSEILEAG